jgi:glycerol-3-phosphate dehydrogenase
LSGDQWDIRSRGVINAAGPFIDAIRQMADPDALPLVVPSAGTHVFVPGLQLSEGVLIPKAPNGSVAFLKPFEGGTLIGTTEEKTGITFDPRTTGEHVEYLRQLANQYLGADHQIAAADITSVWTGIRPLVRDPQKTSTVSLSRTHLIEISKSGLITIGGGKWTSFRRMAQDVVDRAIEVHGLFARSAEPSSVVGSEGWFPGLGGKLADVYRLPIDTAEHLASSYGDRALMVADLNRPALLSKDHPYIEGEVVYAVRYEYAVDPTDVLSRRIRLSFVDEAAARRAVPRVVQIMGRELGWNEPTAAAHLARAQACYAGGLG